jgi:uncharacterized membrane protein
MRISQELFWPYLSGAAAILIGLICHWKRLLQARGTEGLILMGPVFVAVGMAVFGADHLVAPKLVSSFVPSWMPWRFFWGVFVGIALIAAAFSLATGIRATLAAGWLGIMILLFPILIYIPWWLAAPGDRFRQTLVLRDLVLSWCYLAFAANPSHERASLGAAAALSPRIRSGIVVAARIVVAIAIGIYGIEQFSHPEAAPGIPPDGPNLVTTPTWVPGHAVFPYITGVLFVLGALGLLRANLARRAAILLGATSTVLILAVYLPLTVAKASDIDNGLNYMAIHFALAGAMLVLSGAIPKQVGQ